MVDFPDLSASLATLGLRERTWERRTAPRACAASGVLDGAAFEPGAWKAETPAYVPFRVADDHDKLWATKILMRFTREQIRAVGRGAPAVRPARRPTSSPRPCSCGSGSPGGTGSRARARSIASRRTRPRRRAVLRRSPARVPASRRSSVVTPLPGGRVRPRAAGRSARRAEVGPDAAGRACAPVTPAPGGDGYTIVRIDTRRGASELTAYVHLARDAAGAPRVIGVWRP